MATHWGLQFYGPHARNVPNNKINKEIKDTTKRITHPEYWIYIPKTNNSNERSLTNQMLGSHRHIKQFLNSVHYMNHSNLFTYIYNSRVHYITLFNS